jgi:type II secretory pathway predicted ATPase ExeA
MFLEHFKLRVQPFGVTPDAGFLYLSQTHREALSSLPFWIVELPADEQRLEKAPKEEQVPFGPVPQREKP